MNVSGTPGLGELPFFKYFFSTQSKESQQDEIVFLLIPHIVRESVIYAAELRALSIPARCSDRASAGCDAPADDSMWRRMQRLNPARPARRPGHQCGKCGVGGAADGQQVSRPQPGRPASGYRACTGARSGGVLRPRPPQVRL